MSKNQQEYIALTSAGSNQVQNFTALMENFSVAIDATATAYDSMGSASKENEKAMDTISKKLQLLRAEFEKLVIGDGALQDIAKGFLDIGIAILKFANSDVGQVVIKLTALIATLNLVKKGFVALKETTKVLELTRLIKDVVALKSGMATVASSELAMKVATEGLTKAFIANATAWAATPMGLATIAVASIGAIVAISYKLATAVDESTEAYKRNVEELKSAKQEYDDLSNSVESIKSQLESIRQQKLEITDENQLNLLREEEASLERQLQIAEAKAEVARQEAEEKAKALLNENVEFVTPQGEGGYSETVETTRIKAVELYIESLKELKRQQEENEIQMAKYAEAQGVESEEYKRAEENAKSLQEQINLFSTDLTSFLETLQLQREALTSTDAETQALKETIDEMTDAGLAELGMIDESKEALEGLGELLSQLTEEQQEELDMLLEKYPQVSEHLQEIAQEMLNTGVSAEEAANSLGYITETAEEGADATERLADATKELDEALGTLSGMASAYDTLTAAVEEYNSTGQFSLQTLSELNALGVDYISLLDEENGQMTINEQGLNALANAYIDDAEAKAYDKAMAELEAAAQAESNATHRDGQSAGQASAVGSQTAANGAREAAQAALEGAEAWNQYWKEATKGQYAGKVSQATINGIGKSLNASLNSLEKFRASINTNTTAAIKNAGAHNTSTRARSGSTRATNNNTKANNENTKSVDANTEALKRNIEALKDRKQQLESEIKDYETVIGYLNDKVDEQIQKYEKARDKKIDAIEATIKKYEELADKQDEIYKKQIEELEKRRDAEKDAWDAKIQAIKDANEVIEDQIELEKLLQNLELAKSKKVRVYKEGQGFVYDTDQDEVNKAKKELDEYYRKKALEDQIKSLEKQRDDALKIYNQQIADIEKYRQQVKDKYDQINANLKAQIEAIKKKYDGLISPLEKWKKKFAEQTKAYENEVKRQLTIQLTGIDTEKKNWTKRLKNLRSFVKSYNAKLKELANTTKSLEALEAQLKKIEAAANSAKAAVSSSASSGGSSGGYRGGYRGGGGGTSSSSSKPQATPTSNYRMAAYVKRFNTSAEAQKFIVSNKGMGYTAQQVGSGYYIIYSNSLRSYSGITEAQANSYAQALGQSRRASVIKWRYATGVADVGSDRVALVGDDPKNRELVIGSKLNKSQGVPMSLSRGSGVVNAKSTNTLAGLLNMLSDKFTSSNFNSPNTLSNSESNSQDMYIDKVIIEGSNITDVVSFKNSLMNFKSEAIQRAYKRK